ncbi:MAG: lysophospholipid acyltransferase family protein [Elusimicrobia bacterium]|nr:lysophospholipid acyltransferase family protein [Candidatus Obscuribacterium magneticum]
MKKLKHLVEYGFVLLLDAFFSALPLEGACRLGEGIGVLASFLLIRRRRLALENLRRAFPEKSEEEIRRIEKGVWKNLGRTAVEFVRFKDMTAGDLADRFTLEGGENLEKAVKRGGGAICITFHYANWEFNGLFHHRYAPLYAVARPMKNSFVEKWIQEKRSHNNMTMLLHRNAAKACLKVLKEKGHLGILVDQNLYTGGVFVNFFGRPAATTSLPALLHSRTGDPVIVNHSVREGSKFRIVYSPALELPDIENREEKIRAHTQIINDAIERIIRRHPENWFWIHNRWKRQPNLVTPAAGPGLKHDV